MCKIDASLFDQELHALRKLCSWGEIRIFGSYLSGKSEPADLDAAILLGDKEPDWPALHAILGQHPRLDLFVLSEGMLWHARSGLRVGSASYWDGGAENYDEEGDEEAREAEEARRAGVQEDIEKQMLRAIRDGRIL